MVKISKYPAILILLVMGIVILWSFSLVQADFGTNWTVQYYNNKDLSGSPVATQSGISGINFNWGTSSPATGVNADNFSARFTSTQTFNAGTYQFVASSDDGDRVIIDGVTVLDRFVGRSLTTDQFTQTMTGGSHSLEVDYVEYIDQAVIQFQWFLVSGGGGTGVTPGVSTGTPPPIGPMADVVGVKGLAVRTGPYLGASFVTTAVPSTDYPVSGRSHSEGVFNWYLITVGTHTGWASGRYLQLNIDDPNTIPEVGSTFDQIDGAPEIGVVAAPRAVMNLRLRPSVRSPIIGSIAWGAETSLIGRTVQGGKNFWLQIRYNGQVGWVFAPFISIRGEINAVPIR